jgi:hypothetical protein
MDTSLDYFYELLRDGVSRRLLRQQPPGLHIAGTGFLCSLSLSLGRFLQSLGGGADLDRIRGCGLRLRRGCWLTWCRRLNCGLGSNLRRTSYWTDHL